MKLLIASLLFLVSFAPTSDQNRRIKKLEKSLMAPCCYSQTIDEHMSMEAAQMRDEVSDMVLAGKSDREILKYYEAKYGKTILAVPDGTTGVFAFGVPIVAAGSALILFFLLAHTVSKRAKNRLKAQSLQTPSPEILERIRKDVQASL